MIDSGNNMVMPVSPYGNNGGFGDMGGGGLGYAQMPMYDSYGDPMIHSNNYPYAGGYSGHSINDRMIASLEHMMSQTNDKYEQEQIRNEIESIRRK